ncbi:MAG TPA: type II toxin-antitoxin system HicB family antitoxin [Thermomicrobiales bacterium]|jgi:predicted RNase H-like HicB family nuclease
MMVIEERATDASPVSLEALEALHYSLVIEWDPRDAIYVVTVPELTGCRTHGETYAEAVANAQEAIASWVMVAREDGKALPDPKPYRDRGW